MTSPKYFDAISLVVTRSHSWSLVVIRGLLVVTRGHSWSLVVTRGHSWSLVVTRGHSWSLVVIRGHSWSLVCTFRHVHAGSVVTFSLSLLRRLFILHYSFVTLFLIKRGMLHHVPSIVISSPSMLWGCYKTWRPSCMFGLRVPQQKQTLG